MGLGINPWCLFKFWIVYNKLLNQPKLLGRQINPSALTPTGSSAGEFNSELAVGSAADWERGYSVELRFQMVHFLFLVSKSLL